MQHFLSLPLMTTQLKSDGQRGKDGVTRQQVTLLDSPVQSTELLLRHSGMLISHFMMLLTTVQLQLCQMVHEEDHLPQPLLMVESPLGEVMKGDLLRIICKAPGNATERRFHFYRNGEEVAPRKVGSENNISEREGILKNAMVLHFLHAGPQHSGNFTCKYEEKMQERWIPSLTSQAINITINSNKRGNSCFLILRLLVVGGCFFTINSLILVFFWMWVKDKDSSLQFEARLLGTSQTACRSLSTLQLQPSPQHHNASQLPPSAAQCLSISGNSTLLSLPASRVVGAILLGAAALLGLPGNLFVAWSLLRWTQPGCRSVTAVLVLNLALADGAILLLAPFFGLFLAARSWLLGEVACKTLYYICGLSMYASVFIVTLLSLDRCLAVYQPFLSLTLRRKAVATKALVATWLGAAILASPALVYRRVVPDPAAPGQLCEPCHGHPAAAVFHLALETSVAFVLPFTIIAGSYAAILLRLRGRPWHRGGRTGRLIAAVVLCFATLWLPYHVVNVLQATSSVATGQTAENLGRAWKGARAGATALAFLSSSLNPILYAFAAGHLIRSSGADFLARFFEGTSGDLNGNQPAQGHPAMDMVGPPMQ
ncbi:leukotriene B4 receptor 2-like isoform X3 [Struthio camelus]|uniref:leukotriene B4 receptor 2-like isoform X3 n=1 Tax=Struthio camelus TaxID=8801 RepID=UPI0036041F6D